MFKVDIMCSNAITFRLIISFLFFSLVALQAFAVTDSSAASSVNNSANVQAADSVNSYKIERPSHRNLYIEVLGANSTTDVQVSTGLEDEATGLGAVIGVRVTDFINLEAGFIHHGEFDVNDAENDGFETDFRDRNNDDSNNSDALDYNDEFYDAAQQGISSSIRIGAKVNANITDNSYLFARFGMATWMIDYDTQTEGFDIFEVFNNTDETGDGYYYGIGLGVRLNSRFDIGFEFNTMDMDDVENEFDIQISSFGMSLKAYF